MHGNAAALNAFRRAQRAVEQGPGSPRMSLASRNTPGRWLWRLFAAAVLCASVFVGCRLVDQQQRRSIFQAQADTPWTAERRQQRDDGLTNVWIGFDSRASGRKISLHALWWPREESDAPVLLYLHGARRTVETSRVRMEQMREFGFSVLAVDYRGFGQSTDELPSQDGAVEDALAAWDWLAQQHPQRARYIYGHSLGGAIAVQLAARRDDERGLIIDGSFTSIPDVVRSFKWGWLPFEPFITQRFDSAELIADAGSPVLVVHGSHDTFIPPRLGRALYERAAQPKHFVLIDGGLHYGEYATGHRQYREALHALFGLGPG